MLSMPDRHANPLRGNETTQWHLYLAEKTGKLLPTDPVARARVVEMLMFQMASPGPMFGQYLVFAAAWGNKFPQVINRYFTEVSRILSVMDARLQGNAYLVGDEVTIADVACIPWIRLCAIHPVAVDLPFTSNENLVRVSRSSVIY